MARSTKATHFAVYILIRSKSPGHAHSAGILDMLRYDSAHPASEAEAGKLERVSDSAPEWIILRRFVQVGGEKTPSVDRWRSFGWECDWRTFAEMYQADDARQGHARGEAFRNGVR